MGWRYVFWVAAAMYVVGAVPYLIFYRGQVEPWNSGPEKDLPLKERSVQDQPAKNP